MPQLDFLQSLQDNEAIIINETCADWKEAILKCFNPLIKSKVVLPSYVDGVISSTLEYGPYYIISPKLAMPHARPEAGALNDGFSLMTLKEPVYFNNQPIYILIGFAAKDSDVHLAVALPQIVAIFEESSVIEAMIKATSKDEIIAIIKKIDYFKYIK